MPQIGEMAMSSRGRSATTRQPTFIRDWRKHRKLSLEGLSSQLLAREELSITPSQLSRIERNEYPYGQDVLESLARVLDVTAADLLTRAPNDAEPILSLWSRLDADGQSKAAQMIRVMLGLT
jgi:transcriptional regulator with XRE-family HTH domain